MARQRPAGQPPARPARRRTTRRAPGEGAVFWDKDRGRWVGTLDAGRDPKTGRRIRRKVSHPEQEERIRLLDELRTQYKTTGIAPRRDITVKEIVEDWLANPPARARSDKTREGHAIYADRIIAVLGHIPAVKLKPRDVEALLRGMAAEGYATDTISRVRSILVRVINRAERDGIVGRNVADIVETPVGVPAKESRAMNPMQVRRLLAGLTPWWTAWVTVGAMLGLRPGELLGLGWDEVDFKAGVIRVRYALHKEKDEQGHGILVRTELKTKRSKRSCEMPQAVRAALLTLRKIQAADRLRLGKHYQNHGLVFCDVSGQPMWPASVWRWYKNLTAADRARSLDAPGTASHLRELPV